MSNSQKLDRHEIVFIGAIGLFIGSLLLANITAVKLYEITVFGTVFTVPVGTSLFALTFLATDVVSELWGAKHAAVLIVCGFVMRIISLTFISIAIAIPPADSFLLQTEFETILAGSGTILMAGILTYPVSQSTDILVFHFLKKKQSGKNRLWLRNITSTFISQTVDSIVFVWLAFGSSLPSAIIVNIIAGQLIVKFGVAILDTPFVYMIRNFALRRNIFDFKG